MKANERRLAVITAVLAVIILIYYFSGDGPGLSLPAMGAGGDLQAARDVFTKNVDTLKRRELITGEFKKVDVGLPEREGNNTPDKTFYNELYKLLTQQFGVPQPRIERPTLSTIKDVEEYYFVDLEVKIKGDLPEMIRLLQNMETHGLLIKEFTLRKDGTSSDLKVIVARLVKHDKESRRRMKIKAKSQGSRGGPDSDTSMD